MTEINGVVQVKSAFWSSASKMGDAGDILKGLMPSSPRGGQAKRDRKKSSSARRKRPDGVSREVFELQRDNETEFGQSFSADSKPSMAFIKKKQKSIDTKAEKWLKRPFTNPARTDGLNLHHWDKESTSATRDYYFAKFNEKIPVLPCPSPAELTPLIAENTEVAWTYEETKCLLELCCQFDRRFIVVSDRFAQVHPGKTIEQLRDWYYRLARAELERQAQADKSIHLDDEHIFRYKYNPQHEIKRKQQAELLFHRTAGEIEEEKRLFGELKRIETYLKKKPKRSFPSEGQTEDDTPKKKRQRARKNSLQDSGMDSDDLTSSTGGRGGRRDRGSGVFVRSSRMQTPLLIGNTMMKKVDQALDEFAIPRRPIPTSFISKEYNELRQDVVNFLDMQAMTKRKLFELEFYRQQLELVQEQESSTS